MWVESGEIGDDLCEVTVYYAPGMSKESTCLGVHECSVGNRLDSEDDGLMVGVSGGVWGNGGCAEDCVCEDEAFIPKDVDDGAVYEVEHALFWGAGVGGVETVEAAHLSWGEVVAVAYVDSAV